MAKTMQWPIIVKATARDANGKRYRLRRTVEGAGDAEAAMLKALNASPDPLRFLGCKVTSYTVLGQVVERIAKLHAGELILIRPPVQYPGTCS